MSIDQNKNHINPDGTHSSSIHEILKNRAKILARNPAYTNREQDFLEVIAFKLAEENYAIELQFIREVYPFREFTPVPCTPRFVIGVVNIRGQIISVIDLKEFFRLPKRSVGEKDNLIVLRDDEMEFGILVDSIQGVRHVAISGIQTSLPTLDGIREEFLKGVTPDHLIVLDGGKLLCARNLIVHEM